MKWVSISTPPIYEGFYLVRVPPVDDDPPCVVTWYELGYGWVELPDDTAEAITHYMELPSPPED